ncbi:MAG TPA: hypothetical protein VHY35_12185 [Stellaceae bacterium]|jgi:hypothetical protein|nr:hypothetical protein [Stellaceae bacterium]
MVRSVFLEDVARLYRNGLLPGACARIATRPEMWLAYAVVAIIGTFFAHSPVVIGELAIMVVLGTGFYLANAVARTMTPLCFGSFLIGRLTNRYHLLGVGGIYRAEFVLIPSAEELTIPNLPIGTIGTTYLLIRHPSDPSIVLPIIDDNPPYMRRIMMFAPEERRSEIAAQIEKMRLHVDPGFR